MPQPSPPLTTEIRPLEWFILDERELARHDDPEKIRRQGEDMLAKGQLQAVGAIEDGRLIYGHGRWLSANTVGMKMLEVKLFPATLTDTEFQLIRAAENLQRKELTGYRRWLLCAELMCANVSWTQKDLAGHLHLSESMIVRMLSPSKCSGEWQDALKQGKVGISDCYAASKLPLAEQAGLLALKGSGASRDAIESAGRKTRSGHAPVVRASRIKCQLPGGVSIVASGDELSLDDLIEALAEAGKEARKARDQGLDAKTFQAVLRDKAKAG